jgi:hypothetical protein
MICERSREIVVGRDREGAPSRAARVGPRHAIEVIIMHLARAAARRRYWVLFSTAATLAGVVGVITVARADVASTSLPAPFGGVNAREGVMTERLRDCETFERTASEYMDLDSTLELDSTLPSP